MKKIMLLGFALLLAFAFIQTGANAETIKGNVAKVDSTAKTVEVNTVDAVTGAPATAKVTVETATFVGVTDLGGVKEADEVTIVAEKDPVTGNMVAKSVEVAVVRIPEAATPAPAAESK